MIAVHRLHEGLEERGLGGFRRRDGRQHSDSRCDALRLLLLDYDGGMRRRRSRTGRRRWGLFQMAQSLLFPRSDSRRLDCEAAILQKRREGESALLLMEVAGEGLPGQGLTGGDQNLPAECCVHGESLGFREDCVRVAVPTRADGAVVARQVALGHGRRARRHLLVAVGDHARYVAHHGDVLAVRLALLEGQALIRDGGARVAVDVVVLPGSRHRDRRGVQPLLAGALAVPERRDGPVPPSCAHGRRRRDAQDVARRRRRQERLARLLADHSAA